jgi:hypothetical protein
VNNTGVVNISDYASFTAKMGPVTPANKRWDLDRNGIVQEADRTIDGNYYGMACTQ